MTRHNHSRLWSKKTDLRIVNAQTRILRETAETIRGKGAAEHLRHLSWKIRLGHGSFADQEDAVGQRQVIHYAAEHIDHHDLRFTAEVKQALTQISEDIEELAQRRWTKGDRLHEYYEGEKRSILTATILTIFGVLIPLGLAVVFDHLAALILILVPLISLGFYWMLRAPVPENYFIGIRDMFATSISQAVSPSVDRMTTHGPSRRKKHRRLRGHLDY